MIFQIFQTFHNSIMGKLEQADFTLIYVLKFEIFPQFLALTICLFQELSHEHGLGVRLRQQMLHTEHVCEEISLQFGWRRHQGWCRRCHLYVKLSNKISEYRSGMINSKSLLVSFCFELSEKNLIKQLK